MVGEDDDGSNNKDKNNWNNYRRQPKARPILSMSPFELCSEFFVDACLTGAYIQKLVGCFAFQWIILGGAVRRQKSRKIKYGDPKELAWKT
ncbi:hypothetical protein K449DRAFT_436909 [Hypoxylon sp. EC38]|nr:hypothetical protein K449DRAFT_436909 [Hypoxylon sp. EC38]